MKRSQGLSLHQYSCKMNPDRKPSKGGFKTGYTMSDTTKKKISWVGRTHSAEVKEKISKSRIAYLKFSS